MVDVKMVDMKMIDIETSDILMRSGSGEDIQGNGYEV